MTAAFATIAALLSNTQRQLRHRHLRLVLTLYPVYAVVYVGCFAAAIFALLQAWRGQEWMDFWLVAMPMVNLGGLSLATMDWIDFRTQLFARVTLMQEAAQTGDETLAPVAANGHGENPAIDPPMVESTSMGPFHRPTALHTDPFMLVTFVLVMALVLVVPTLLAFGNAVFGATLATTLVLCGGALGLLAQRTFGSFYARVDAEGLRWPAIIGRPHRLRWSEAQSLICVTDERQITDDRRTVYAVIGETAAFAWTITGDSSETTAGVASRQLVHAITQHTGLPLRDLSTEARRLAHRNHTGVTSQRKPRVLVMSFAPILLLMLVAGVLQVIQPWYFEYVYARAHTTTPLYANPLTHPDGDWPVTESTDNAIAFIDHRFTITHDLNHFTGRPGFIPSPRHFDNALYEVTPYAYGRSTDGAGLAILGKQQSQPMLAFYVDMLGDWRLEPMTLDGESNYRLSRSDSSSAIHVGLTASNRIAVLVQGSDFIFYVNGHYMTHYHDDHYAGGYIGLYLHPISQHGSFTDFAIYPA